MNDLLDQDKKAPANYFNELVGEDKKFKTPEDLARGKYEADVFVETMKSRFDELRADYLKLKEETASRASVEELINQYRSEQESASSALPVAKEVREPQFDSKKIEDLVFSKVQAIESSKKEDQNFNEIRNKLKEKFGEKYPEVLKQQIDDLGLTNEFANDLARKHPSVFLKTFGLNEQPKQQNFQTPPRNNVMNDNFKPTGPTQKTWNYYQEMRKEKPDLYYSKRIQNEMHNAALELGDAFTDGDFSETDKNLLRRLER